MIKGSAVLALLSLLAASAMWLRGPTHAPSPSTPSRTPSHLRHAASLATSTPAEEGRSAPMRVGDPSHASASPVRYLAIGGGATPESTEVSLEQDLSLAERVFPGSGKLLFAGGADSPCVRTLDPVRDERSVLSRLGDLFSPRAGRTSRYRKPKLAGAQRAGLAQVESELQRALERGTDPLLLYVAAHGEQGESASDNHVVLWGGETLTVARLAELHGVRPRPLRMLIASCFSGGFAELAFEGAVARNGASAAPRCGLFAGTWDRETSGCDPNPDRRAQESYSLHVLHALAGEDRDGKPLDKAVVDLDGDGAIGLLEAHTRARIASTSIDVPTTTSERYLREVQRRAGALDERASPEDAAVIAQLGARLGLLTHAAVESRLHALDADLERLDAQLDQTEAAHDELGADLSTELLERWPVLDDAYHPDFAATLAAHGKEIARVLDHGQTARAYTESLERLNDLDARYSDTQTQEAVVTRLRRAYETLQLASALAKRGGKAYESYRKLVACERQPL